MNALTNTMQDIVLSSSPSSMSASSNVLASPSSDSSRKPSSATSIFPSSLEASALSLKPSHVPVIVSGSARSKDSISDDLTQGHLRALRRQAIARKISAHLRTLPPSSSVSLSAEESILDERLSYIDALVAREPDTYTPALAAYFAAHVDAIPKRVEDSATQKRKRYDAYEAITDRNGRTTRVDARQARLFKGWEWDGVHVSAKGHDVDIGPKGEGERGEDVRCAHCERKERKSEMRKVAIKGLGRLLGRSHIGSSNKAKSPAMGVLATRSEKSTGKMVREAVSEQVERVDTRPYGTIRVR